MGSVIGLPVTVCSFIAEKGLSYVIPYCLSSIYLRITRYFKGKRLNDYDFTANDQPEKIGFLAPELEWELDFPRKDAPLKQVKDGAFCFGTNSNGDSLAVYISRQSDEMVRCSLLFQLASGKKFMLPEEHLLQKESADLNTFGSSRLKLQCNLPMRKWRIFFNGILKEDSQPGRQEYKHVKFTFIWTASSEVFDFKTDTSDAILADVAAKSKSWLPFGHLEKIKDIFDNYEQPGMILGTYSIENEQEQELYLWGIRGRYMGRTCELTKGYFSQIYGQFQTGAAVHLEILNIPVTGRFIHGYVMHSNGFINCIENLCEKSSEQDEDQKFQFCCGHLKYNLVVKKGKFESNSFQKEYIGETTLTSAKMMLNDVEGNGFSFSGIIQKAPLFPSLEVKPKSWLSKARLLIVDFEAAECQDHNLTGGKGSSLGKLFSLSNTLEKDGDYSDVTFQVPKGIVVTTEAYKLFTEGELDGYLRDFEKTVSEVNAVDLNQLCARTMNKIKESVFPNEIHDFLRTGLRRIFGNDAEKCRFAVRSSATGEDTEQMSAAGQMETYLGLKGIDEIEAAIKKCWASQFSFQAVEYKRRYGQLLNTPMAVVIQEMVPCEKAGVLFTCDPVTGNPAFISITANWGLGESVVSASAEPDTITLKRTIDDELELDSCQIGNKEKKVVMEGESGTKEVNVEAGSDQLCINEDMALKLGELAVKIEKHYGSPRDIEWGILDDKIYLFQARPITSLDIDTDFETKHMFDNYLRMEKEYVTKANIGEVMPGAISPLGIDMMVKIFSTLYQRQGRFRWDGYGVPDAPYFQRLSSYHYQHGFINFIDCFFRFGMKDPFFLKGMLISILGRVIDYTEMAQIAEERHGHNDPGRLHAIGMKFKLLDTLLLAEYKVRKISRAFTKISFPSMEGLHSMEILLGIGRTFYHCIDIMNAHMAASTASSTWNQILLSLLAKDENDFDANVYSDFAYLLSTCTDIESADVPSAIQSLGKSISNCVDVEKFRSMSPEDALRYLKSSPSVLNRLNEFTEKHGHRCLKEFDVHAKPWDSEPGMLMLVKMLQSYVTSDIKPVIKKDLSTFSAILSHMHVHLSFTSRLMLRLILPHCRRGVRGREFAKSLVIKSIYKLRKAIQELAARMVQEGRLPDEELIYFMCFDEIKQLIKTRSPRILTRAIRRQKVYAELDKLKFPEICIGVPRPINDEDNDVHLGEGFEMRGTPVSQGVVKGVARVIENFAEVSQIQQEDILITYSTDIGWSPYFPLLSGVVTELGGLISHGAVVAREYGLPCVVGLHGATKVFKSGDIVLLDGNRGILKKIETN